ncbi:hypothetical protein LH20_00745 [Sphingopyxis sp. 113P3]|nr:hypothetical protein LH20_00745 [Sphingopyxis sp. 113P3]
MEELGTIARVSQYEIVGGAHPPRLAGPHCPQRRRHATTGARSRPRHVEFALDQPGRFRLMFRKDLVNRDDPRFAYSKTVAREVALASG